VRIRPGVAPPQFLQKFSPRGRRFASALFPPATAELAPPLFCFARRNFGGRFSSCSCAGTIAGDSKAKCPRASSERATGLSETGEGVRLQHSPTSPLPWLDCLRGRMAEYYWTTNPAQRISRGPKQVGECLAPFTPNEVRLKIGLMVASFDLGEDVRYDTYGMA
jgi:hypothetical protein